MKTFNKTVNCILNIITQSSQNDPVLIDYGDSKKDTLGFESNFFSNAHFCYFNNF